MLEYEPQSRFNQKRWCEKAFSVERHIQEHAATIESSALDCRKRSVIWWAFEKYVSMYCVLRTVQNDNPFCLSGLPLWLSWWRVHQQWGRPQFDPWVGKIPGEEKGYPVFWPGEFHGLYSPSGSEELDMTEWRSLSLLSVKLSTEEWAHRISSLNCASVVEKIPWRRK